MSGSVSWPQQQIHIDENDDIIYGKPGEMKQDITM